jgi:hypothetical protein
LGYLILKEVKLRMSWAEVKKINSDLTKALDVRMTEQFNVLQTGINNVLPKMKTILGSVVVPQTTEATTLYDISGAGILHYIYIRTDGLTGVSLNFSAFVDGGRMDGGGQWSTKNLGVNAQAKYAGGMFAPGGRSSGDGFVYAKTFETLDVLASGGFYLGIPFSSSFEIKTSLANDGAGAETKLVVCYSKAVA